MIVEVNPNANIGLDARVVATGGTVAIYACEDSDAAVPIPIRPSMTKNVRYQLILTYTTTAEQKQNAVGVVSEAARDGALTVGADSGLPFTRFPFAETAQAHRVVEEGALGKVLIDVASG